MEACSEVIFYMIVFLNKKDTDNFAFLYIIHSFIQASLVQLKNNLEHRKTFKFEVLKKYEQHENL